MTTVRLLDNVSGLIRFGYVSLLVLVAASPLTFSAHGQEFGYHGTVGPEAEEWCALGANYAACCQGTSQSPIDIITSDAEIDSKLPGLRFDYKGKVTLNVVNNGHTVQSNVPAGSGTLNLGGVVYDLQQFHFHTPSEHRVNGTHAPIEMHLVHKTPDGSQTAVVGVLIQPGKEDKELEKVWSVLPDEESEQATVTDFQLRAILPGGNGFSYRYPGSLTTPPCTEGVSWNLMANPITMSPAQIGKFQGVFSGEEFPQGNARPVQPLGTRKVVTDAKK
jgi:carbonic anhydrase